MKHLLFLIAFLLFPVVALAQTPVTLYVDTDCTNNGDGTLSTCAASPGAVGAYTSMENAANDIDTDYADLRSGGSNVTITVKFAGAAADTSQPIWTGVLTDSTHLISLVCDGAKSTGCRSTSDTTYSTARYRLETINYIGAIRVLIGHMSINRLQIKSACDHDCRGTGVTWEGLVGGILTVNSNWIWYAAPTTITTSGDASFGIDILNNEATGAKQLIAVNNIIYDFRDGGIRCNTNGSNGSSCILYNNTIADIPEDTDSHCILVDGYGTNDTLVAKNNLMQNCAGTDWDTDGTTWTSITTARNITEDASSPDASYGSKVVTFVNEGANDWHLDAADTSARNAAEDLSADGTYDFTIDFETQTRTVPWDVGADENITAPAMVDDLPVLHYAIGGA